MITPFGCRAYEQAQRDRMRHIKHYLNTLEREHMDRKENEGGRLGDASVVNAATEEKVRYVDRNMSDEGIEALTAKALKIEKDIDNLNRSIEVSVQKIAIDVHYREKLLIERDKLRKDLNWAGQYAKPTPGLFPSLDRDG